MQSGSRQAAQYAFEAELEQLLHPEVRQELTPTLIGDTWASVLTEVGARETFEDTHVVLPPGHEPLAF